MTRIKKSRKPGSLGLRKTEKRPENTAKTPRKTARKGLTAGARNGQLEARDNPVSSKQPPQDSRVGSKKPISLVEPPKQDTLAPSKPKQPQAKINKQKKPVEPVEAWQKELNALENDQALQDLLDRYDNNEQLSAAELAELNKKMARHSWLIEKLGLDDLAEDADEALLDEWENSQLKDEDF